MLAMTCCGTQAQSMNHLSISGGQTNNPDAKPNDIRLMGVYFD